MEVRLVVTAPPDARATHATKLPCVVGRGEDSGLRVQQDSVSRRHCELTSAHGVVTVTDLGSTNGTFVAGKRIKAHIPAVVSSGTEVRIGETVLRIEYQRSAASAARAPQESDTVPLPAVEAGPPPAEPAELAELEPAAPAADHWPEVPAAGGESSPPAEEASLDALAAEAASAPPPDDDNLNDFFKSLS